MIPDVSGIMLALAAIYAVLRWVDYAGTRVAARHPRSGSQVITAAEFPPGFVPPSASPLPPGGHR